MDDDVGGLDAVSLHLQVHQLECGQYAVSSPHHVHGSYAGAAQVFAQNEGDFRLNVGNSKVAYRYFSIVGVDAGAEDMAIAGFVNAQVIAGRLGGQRHLVAGHRFGRL